MEVKPWKKVGEPELIIKKRDRKLILQKLEDPHTHTIEDFYLIKTAVFASIVLPLTIDKNVLAVKQYRPAADKILMELPGGTPKTPEQTPEQVAEEELFEESSGYKANKIIRLNKDPLWFNPLLFTTPFHAFIALDCRQTNRPSELDKGEYLELLKIPWDEWLSMCINGQIVDSKSITVTFLALKEMRLKIVDIR